MPSGNANVWASNQPTSGEEDLVLPSTQTCRARRVSIETLLEMGIVAEADTLTPLVQQYTKDIQRGGPSSPKETVIDEAAMMQDPETLKKIIFLADKSMPHIVISPRVALHFKETTVGKTTVTKAYTDAERAEIRETQPDIIFTDQIGLEDKMYLFEWALGGLAKMVTFRPGSQADVGSVGSGKRNKKSAKRGSRSN